MLDEGLEVRAVFQDSSKAFNKAQKTDLQITTERYFGWIIGYSEQFPKQWETKIVHNSQSSDWADGDAGVQGLIMGPLLSLIYIKDLPEGLKTIAKLFADITSLFSFVRDIAASSKELNNYLINISKWAYQWKTIFKPDLTKQAQEVIFSRKLNKPSHPNQLLTNQWIFNNHHQ